MMDVLNLPDASAENGASPWPSEMGRPAWLVYR